MEETILDKMREDHTAIMDLMISVQDTKDPAQMKEFFQLLKTRLIHHMIAEEETIYKRLVIDINEDHAHELVENSEMEHHETKEYLQRLTLMNIEDSSWRVIFSDLVRTVIHHFKSEEDNLFNEIKEDFSKEELMEITSEYEYARASS